MAWGEIVKSSADLRCYLFFKRTMIMQDKGNSSEISGIISFWRIY